METTMELFTPSPVSQTDTIALWGYVLTMRSGFKEYNAVREAFSRRQYQAEQEMRRLYSSQVHSVDDLYETAIPALEQINQESAEFAASVLMHYGIDHVSADTLLTLPEKRFQEKDKDGNVTTSSWSLGKRIRSLKSGFVGPILEKAEQLDAYKDGLSAQRSAERSSRSKWVGSGYGIRGALTGAAKAAALNAGTSVLRGIGDSVVDAADAAKIASMKRSLVKDPDTVSAYVTVAAGVVSFLQDAVLGYLCGTMQGTLPAGQRPPLTYTVSSADSEKALAKLKNASMLFDRDQLSEDGFKKKGLEVLIEDPWNEKTWTELYSNLTDPASRRELVEVMPYLGMQYSVGRGFIETDAAAKKAGYGEFVQGLDERRELIEFMLRADPDALARKYIPLAYLHKNGFYIETTDGGPGSLEQREYAMHKDESLPDSLPVVIEHNNVPLSGSARLILPDCVYTGQFENGRINGQGTVEYADGETFCGTLHDGVWVEGKWHSAGSMYEGGFLYENSQYLRHGKGRSSYSSGLPFPLEEGFKLPRKERKEREGTHPAVVEGQFDHGRLNGPVKIISTGFELSGTCVDHVFEGVMHIRTPDFHGSGTFDGGHWIHGEITYNNGDRYEGDVLNADGICKAWSRTGQGVCTFASGDQYAGSWENGKMHGTGIMKTAAGETYTGDWMNGRRHGQGVLTDSSGSIIYEGEWKKDKRKGDGVFSRMFGKK